MMNLLFLAPLAAASYDPPAGSQRDLYERRYDGAELCIELQRDYASCDPENPQGVTGDLGLQPDMSLLWDEDDEWLAHYCRLARQTNNGITCGNGLEIPKCLSEYQDWQNCITSYVCEFEFDCDPSDEYYYYYYYVDEEVDIDVPVVDEEEPDVPRVDEEVDIEMIGDDGESNGALGLAAPFAAASAAEIRRVGRTSGKPRRAVFLAPSISSSTSARRQAITFP